MPRRKRGSGPASPVSPRFAFMASEYLVYPLPIVAARAPSVNAAVTADPAVLSKMPVSPRIVVTVE